MSAFFQYFFYLLLGCSSPKNLGLLFIVALGLRQEESRSRGYCGMIRISNDLGGFAHGEQTNFESGPPRARSELGAAQAPAQAHCGAGAAQLAPRSRSAAKPTL